LKVSDEIKLEHTREFPFNKKTFFEVAPRPPSHSHRCLLIGSIIGNMLQRCGALGDLDDLRGRFKPRASRRVLDACPRGELNSIAVKTIRKRNRIDNEAINEKAEDGFGGTFGPHLASRMGVAIVF
jgi:hypothetical protein